MQDKNPDIAWLKKGLERIEHNVNKLSDKLDMYIDRFETKENALLTYQRLEKEIECKADKEKVQKIQKLLDWAVLIVIGAVLTAVLATVII